MIGSGWRGLGLFWLAVIIVTGGGMAALQAMGPMVSAAPPVEEVASAPVAVLPPMPPFSPGPPIAPRQAGGAIPGPDAALLEPALDFPGAKLPRIAADGRASMRVYARPFDISDKRPRVAMLVTGLGLNTIDSRAAIASLPPAVSLGVSPYAHDPQAMLDDIRAHGHEFLVTLPMESQGYPLNNSGPQALMTGADPAENARHLEWALSRFGGEVGVTGASDGLRGERFAASAASIGPVLRDIARRGLLYVDPRPETQGNGITVTSVVDDGGDLDAKLAGLEQQARTGGVALGLATRVRPATVERIAAWARGLDGRGIALVPVSALVPKG